MVLILPKPQNYFILECNGHYLVLRYLNLRLFYNCPIVLKTFQMIYLQIFLPISFTNLSLNNYFELCLIHPLYNLKFIFAHYFQYELFIFCFQRISII